MLKFYDKNGEKCYKRVLQNYSISVRNKIILFYNRQNEMLLNAARLKTKLKLNKNSTDEHTDSIYVSSYKSLWSYLEITPHFHGDTP